MLGRMAGAHNDAPGIRTDLEFFAIGHPAVAVGQGMDVFAKFAKTALVVFDGCIAPAGLAEKRDALVGRLAAGVGCQHAAVQVFKPRHPQAAFEFAREPARHAHVVGVHVGDKDAAQGALVMSVCKQLAPGRQCGVGADAGVHHRPATFFLNAPDVDVVEDERQRHSHPDHARRDLNRPAHAGRCLKRVDEGWLLQAFSLQ